jgi:enoyl-CoA hydratase/carnithine racemase
MIKCEVADRLARITFARPGEGNAFTGDMIRQLRDAVRDCDTRADILTMAGEGADFTLGRDRKEPMSAPPFDAFSLITDLNESLSNFRGIVVSAVRGRAFGLGVGLIMRSDLAIASEDAEFALDEVKLGIPPMFVMAAIVDHMAPKRALDVILTSREFTAKEALDIGLLSRVVPASELDASVEKLIGELRARDREVLRACKRYLHAVNKMPVEARPAHALIEQTRFALRPR